ncbi:hypothetical protein TWF730_001758 [Orbilia blumenaviensis]|uniref:DNA 3'-5' helicase n=1 Tax=Orbilia blumenaviensis TaxID=1796055 RepID=A0AAV9UKS0_9PEZI
MASRVRLGSVTFEDVTAKFEEIRPLNFAVCKLTTPQISTALKVAICRECKYVVLAKTIVNHLVGNKDHQIKRRTVNNQAEAVIRSLTGYLSSEENIVAFSDAIKTKSITEIPYLAVSLGWQCHLCSRVYSTKDSISSHRGRCPADIRPVGQRSHPKLLDKDKISCQTFLPARNKSLFKVQLQETGPVASNEARFVQEMLDERLNVSDGAEELSTPVPWLQRTGWLEFCGGSQESIVAVCALPRLDVDRSPQIDVIQNATRHLLQSSLPYIDQTAIQFLCKLKSPNDEDDGRPFTREYSVGALDDYFNTMTRMVVYFCRLLLNDELAFKCGVDFPDEVERILRAILQVSEFAATSGSQPDMEALRMDILEVIIECMKTPIPITIISRFDHPVLNYLATQGWSVENRTWKTADFCTKTFAAMSYCTRLLVLRRSWELASMVGEEDAVILNDALKEELDQLLPITKEANGFPMSEWLSQHAYGHAITDHSSKAGKLHWNKDGTGVYYGGDLFLIESHRLYVRSIAPSLEAMLNQQMLGLNNRILPSQVFDDPSDSSRGYSCCSDPKNATLFQPKLLLERVESTPALAKKFFPDSGVLSHTASHEYLEQDMEIRKLFAIAALLTAGEPARGTELSTLRKYNTAINPRNFFVIDGDVMLLSAYIKTQHVTGYQKGIARFFPESIGTLFLTYLMIVDPFADYLRTRRSMNVTSYLFAGADGVPWTTQMYTNYMLTNVQAVTGFPLKISSYRQIMAGITRAYVDPMSQLIEKRVEEEENVAAEQFGHGRRTNLNRYGRDANRFIHMDEITMDLYRRATAFFQFFIGVTPQLPNWLIEPSKIYFSVGAQPRFGHPAFPHSTQLDPARLQVLHAPRLAFEQAPAYIPSTGPASHLPPGSSDYSGSSAVSNLFSIRDEYPPELHAVLYKQYSTAQADGTMSRVQWKLPEQAQAAEAIYKRNISPLLITLACAAGKTTAALLAIKAAKSGISVIIEPFISTCDDVASRAADMGIHVTYWVSEIVGHDANGQPVYKLQAPKRIEKKVPGVIIATPEAAISPKFLEQISRLHAERRLDRIIVDEIHQQILDEGFRDVAALSKLTNLGLQLVCMSATVPPLMLAPICNFFHVNSFQEIRSTTNVPNMQYKVMTVEDLIGEAVHYINALKAQFSALGVQPQRNKILAFCRSREQAEDLKDQLNAYKYEGEMNIDDRQDTLDEWDETGGVLFATTAFGPGVDAKNVVAVVHVGRPYTLVDLVQQSSRAGRDGSPAVNTVICRRSSFFDVNYNNRQLWRKEAYKALDMYLTTKGCRRWVISSFMDGNHKAIDCVMGGMALCDNCDTERRGPEYVATTVARRTPALELPRLDRNAARATQAANIVSFITAAQTNCAYCRFTLGCEAGHSIDDCPTYIPLDQYPNWTQDVCVECGIPKGICLRASSMEGCKCSEACLALYTAVFYDQAIRIHVFGEMGVREQNLNAWGNYCSWLAETVLMERETYSNAWKVLQTLEELHYLF